MTNEQIELCCISVLQRHNIERSVLAFRGYAEDALCIEKEKIGYSSYYGFHGKKEGKKWNPTLVGAIRRNLRDISTSKKEEKSLLRDFRAELKFYNL